MHHDYQTCIDACNACASECERCATACLDEPDPKTMARCIQLDRDCARICQAAAATMASGSDFAAQLCRVCAAICRACGEECRRHKIDHCQHCADACERCAEECEKMASVCV